MPVDDRRIRLRCPTCGKAYLLKPELAGKTAKCTCGARLKIPAPVEAPISPPPTPTPERLTNDKFMDDLEFVDPAVSTARPFDDSELAASPQDKDELELEAPPELAVPESIRRAADAGKLAAARPGAERSRGSESSWALKFVGVYGLIMALCALQVLLNIFGFFYAVVRPQVTIPIAAFLLVAFSINTGITYVIYRLGRGLVDGERAAVHGLTVLYVLHLMAAALVFAVGASEPRAAPQLTLAATLVAAVSTIIYLPPLLVGYLNWGDFHSDAD